MWFTLKCLAHRPGPCERSFVVRAHLGRKFYLLGGRKCYTRPPRLRETDRNGLFGGTRSVLPFADVLYFFTDEFSGLGGSGLAAAGISPSFSDCGFFRHARY